MRVLIAVLFLASLAGCVADETPVNTADPLARLPQEAVSPDHVQLASEPAPGTPQEHGTAELVWDEIRTEKTLDGYTAHRTGRIDNDFGGAAAARVTFELDDEALRVEPSPDGDYHYIIKTLAWAPTEDMAKEKVQEVQVHHQDGLTDEGLVLSTSAEVPPTVQAGPVSFRVQDARVASITAQVPAGPLYTLTARGGDEITVKGIDGPRFMLRSPYGPVRVTDGSVEDLWVDAYDGVTLADLAVVEMYGKAGYGDVIVKRTDAWDAELRSGSGKIRLTDVNATTLSATSTSGLVSILGGTFTDLEVKARGDVALQRVQGQNVGIRSEYGDITVVNATAPTLTVTADSGGMALKGIEAKGLTARVRSSGGADLTDINADTLDLRCGYGDTVLGQVDVGVLTFDSGGDLRMVGIQAVQTQITLGSGSGSAKGLRSDAVVFRSGSADIDLKDLDVADLQVLSSSGGIKVDGLGSDTVSMKTGSSGSLDLRRIAAREVTLATANGGQSVEDLTAARLIASGGHVTFSLHGLSLQDLSVDADGGDVDLAGALHNLTVVTDGGDVTTSLEALGGTWNVRSGSGAVDLRVTEVDQADGFDVTARTESGEIGVGLPDMLIKEPEEGVVHAVTLGYEHRAVQSVFTVSTTRGDIDVQSG